MIARLMSMLDRFNREHPWSHNDAYARVVVRSARMVRRSGGKSALDIGCGTGNLVRRLARELPDVIGIESDAVTAMRAARSTAGLPAVRILHSSFPTAQQPQFDLVSMVAVLHHLPLTAGARAARRAVAPGGRVVIVGVYREMPTDRWLSLISLVLNPLVGAVRHPKRATTAPTQMTAPTVDAIDSYATIKHTLRVELPGIRVRRGLFWRYVATWRAPK